MSSGGRDNGSSIYVFKLCLLPQTMECWWGPHAPTGCTHLIYPAGTNAPLSYREAPCEPKGMLLLLFCSGFFFFFKNFPYAWQILNQKRLGNSTLRSCQQSTCEVNLIDGKRKRKPGGRGREAKSMNERLRKCPLSSLPSSQQRVFQVWRLCLICWFVKIRCHLDDCIVTLGQIRV